MKPGQSQELLNSVLPITGVCLCTPVKDLVLPCASAGLPTQIERHQAAKNLDPLIASV